MNCEELGRIVRETEISWAKELPPEKRPPYWLTPWEEISESHREVARRIGERLFALGAAESRAFLDVCRHRIAELETAIQAYHGLVLTTGVQRELGWNRVLAALQEDFRQAVITSVDMTDEQRADWLDESDKAEALG